MPDPSFILPLLLQSAVIPFLAAAAVATAAPAMRPQMQGAKQASGSMPLAPALAIMLGFLASYFAILHAQWSPLPKQSLDWLPWILAAALPGAVLSERLETRSARLSARAALVVGALALTAWPALPGIGAPMAGAVTVIAAALVCAAWTLFASVAARRTALLPVAIISGASALALMLDSSQLIGQLTGALAAALCAFITIGLLRPRGAPAGASSGISVLLLGALLANAYLYAGFPLLTIALLAGGLLAAAFALSLERRGILTARASCIVAIALCAIPALIAVALAVKAAQDSGGY